MTVTRLINEGLDNARAYRERNPMTPPAEPKGELSEKTKAEIAAGQQTVVERFLAKEFDPEYNEDQEPEL